MKEENGNLISGHASINIEASKKMTREDFDKAMIGTLDHDANDVWAKLQELNGNNERSNKPGKKDIIA